MQGGHAKPLDGELLQMSPPQWLAMLHASYAMNWLQHISEFKHLSSDSICLRSRPVYPANNSLPLISWLHGTISAAWVHVADVENSIIVTMCTLRWPLGHVWTSKERMLAQELETYRVFSAEQDFKYASKTFIQVSVIRHHGVCCGMSVNDSFRE